MRHEWKRPYSIQFSCTIWTIYKTVSHSTNTDIVLRAALWSLIAHSRGNDPDKIVGEAQGHRFINCNVP